MTVEYGHCGSLDWTVEKWGRVTHKHSCPNRTDPFCQSHPWFCLTVAGTEAEAMTEPKALLAAATPRPWRVEPTEDHPGWRWTAIRSDDPLGELLCAPAEPDAALIVAAVNDYERLLAIEEAAIWLRDHSTPRHAATCAGQDDDAPCICGVSEGYVSALAALTEKVP